jgi:hypothetical protein
MDLEQSIKRNIQIAKMIKAKHDNDGFPGNSPKRDALEARYYLALLSDIDKARSALDSGGLAEISDDFDYNKTPQPAVQHGKVGGGGRKAKKESKPGSDGQEALKESET